MRLKDRRRLIVAAAALVVVAGGAFSVFVVRGWQRTGITGRYLQQGLAAYKKGDYFHALNDTGQFILRTKKDDPRRPEALKAYAESRSKIPEADGRHLKEAISFYQQYVERRPDDRDARISLLQLYNQSGYFVEARELAAKMLPTDLAKATADDIPILREQAKSLLLSKDLATQRAGTGPVLEKVLSRLLELAPLDVEGNAARIDYLVQTKRSAELGPMADAIEKAHPDDPAALLIAAVARQIAAGRGFYDQQGNAVRAQVRAGLCKAAGLDLATGKRAAPAAYTDRDLADRLATSLEAMQLPDYAIAVLEDGADRLKDPALLSRLVRRLWQEARDTEVDQRVAPLDVASRETDPDVLGLRGLSLLRLGRSDEAAQLAKALEAREGDYRATAWAKVIPLADSKRAIKPADAVSGFQAAVKATAGHEPVILQFLGESLAAMGRADEARQAWARAAELPAASAWVAPHMRTAETLLADGRYDEAARAAARATGISPNLVLASVLWCEAQAGRFQNGAVDDPRPGQVLARLNELDAALAVKSGSTDAAGAAALRERLLSTRIVLLARTDQSAAKAAIEATLASADKLKPETLQRLANVCAQERLGFEDRFIEAAEKAGGSSLTLALSKAASKAAQGNPEEGLALLQRAAADSPTSRDAAIAIPRYIEQTGLPNAKEAWADLARRFPDDLTVQRAVLASAAASENRALIEQTIAKYSASLGLSEGADDPLSRMARARAILRSTPSRADYDKAVGLLQSVANEQPSNAAPKLLLASALTYSDPAKGIAPDVQRAIGLLSDAAVLQPNSASIALDLAALLQQQRDFGRAKELLVRVAQDDGVSPELRQGAAELLIKQGEQSERNSVAVATLEDLAKKQDKLAKPAILTTLAEVYLAKGQTAEGEALYKRLADGAAADADSVYLTARHYTLKGDAERAAAALKRLDGFKLGPGIKEYVLARLAAEQGNVEGSAAHYEASLKERSSRPDVWYSYATLFLAPSSKLESDEELAARATKAADVCRRAQAAAPGNPQIASLLAQAEALATGGSDPDIAELVQVLNLSARATTQADEMIRAVREAKSRGEFGNADALARLADRFRTAGQFQLFIARRIFALDRTRAAALTDRALVGNPDDPAVARGGCQVYRELQAFDQMDLAARRWKGLDASGSSEPDIAIAEASLGLQRYTDGIKALQPRLAAAVRAPEDAYSDAILRTQARLLIASGKPGDAAALLRPLLAGSRTVRMIWITLAAAELSKLEDARAWLQEIQGLLSADAFVERLAIGTSYAILADRPELKAQMTQLLSTSMETLTKLGEDASAAKSPQAGMAFEALGKIRQRTGDNAGAETAYRHAIELDPGRGDALNNLADMLKESKRLDEALTFAKQAVKACEGSSSSVGSLANALDTLATVYLALAQQSQDKRDLPAAVGQYKLAAGTYMRLSARLPQDPVPLRGAATALDKAGDAAGAAATYERYYAMPNLKAPLAAEARNNLAMNLVRLNRSAADLDRAAKLAGEAVRMLEIPAFLDTQGWAELAAGHGPAAAAIFRKGIQKAEAAKNQLTPVPPSSLIGLATALAAGSAEEKQEAAQALERVDPGSLDAEDAARLQKARSLLNAGSR